MLESSGKSGHFSTVVGDIMDGYISVRGSVLVGLREHYLWTGTITPSTGFYMLVTFCFWFERGYANECG